MNCKSLFAPQDKGVKISVFKFFLYFRSNIFTTVKSHIHTNHNDAAWLFLAELSDAIPLKDVQFIRLYLESSLSEIEDVSVEKLPSALREKV